jgi:DNA ligase-1
VRRLAAALDEARRSRSRLAKEAAIGRALAAIAADGDDVSLAVAARLAAGRALPVGDGRSLGVGWRLVAESAMAQAEVPPEIFGPCVRTCGDMGEAFGLLLAGAPGAHERPGVPLAKVAALASDLADMSSRIAKRRRLDELFARATPLEAKYLTKALLGELRIGAQAGVVEAAIARGFGADPAEVRRAAALVTDPGELAVLTARGRLNEARVKIGRPVAYMLATPMETVVAPIDPSAFVVEDKIDGVRAQLHKRAGDVWIYGRGLDEVTAAFPEVAAAFRFAKGDVALDGELVATLPDGRPRPFMALQSRLGRVAPSVELVREVPVTFIAYDLLVDGEEELLALPWSERRARLETFARERGPREAFVLNGAAPLAAGDSGAVLDARFEEARARGHEGLVLKRADASYDAGRRGQAWIKVKKAYATLDVVVTAVEEGHGRRAGVLSDYTFGVWKDGAIVNVGKAYSGLTDDEIDQMQRRFERMTVERFGGVRAVRPEVVLEVAFDGIQRSTRHKSGFALRFPRIVRVRDDKRPEEADKLEAVEGLFHAQLASGHREDRAAQGKEARARRVGTGRGAKASAAQLDLFTPVRDPSPGEGTDDDARADRSDRGRTGPRGRS